MTAVTVVKDIMSSDVVTVTPETSVYAAARVMAQEEVGSVVVVVGEKPVGIITERDLVRKVLAGGLSPRKTSVSKVMSSPVVVVGENTSLEEAVSIMAQNRIRRLLVVSGEKLVGIVSATDIMKALGAEAARALPAILRG
ncbi:MAG: CBS domain-containing protein [Candidatus Caldarchaeum sp.]|nr:CBS domain-containing protein [Candidatus Caldarchaeum sp.]MDW8063616.1 CBS domain-containing protein [Candidatus Caldarchaeum sp.]MDW8435785.1 CBS domain-containing protein [Candidatus Caldarchaeum sp.]